MDFDALKEMFSGLDPETLLQKLIPPLDTVLGWVELAARLAVLAGHLVLLALGLMYLLTPPKEANYSAGYRCWWGMASLEAWRFTQRVAGMAWTGLGLVLTVVMSVLCLKFGEMNPVDMLWTAGKYLLWQLGLAVLACIVINLTVIVAFDRFGHRRNEPLE